MSSKPREWKLEPASFVVVANRLPVDRVENPDGGAIFRLTLPLVQSEMKEPYHRIAVSNVA